MISIQTIRARIVVSGIAVVLVACAAISLLAIQNLAELAEEDSDAILEQMAARYANNIEKEIGKAVLTASTLTQAIEGLQRSGEFSPESVAQLVTNVVAKHPEYVGSTAAWEPNKFNGNDSALIGQQYSDASGRYVPYFYNTSSGVAVEILDMRPEAGTGEWYDRPVRENRSVLTPPYIYPVDGVDVLMTTASIPIRDANKKAIGIVTIDTGLEQVQSIVSKITPFETGFAYLMSHDGQWVSAPDKALLGQPVEDELAKRILKTVASGKKFHEITEIDGVEMLSVAIPVNFGTDENWILAIHAEEDQVFSSSNATSNILILLSLFAIVVATGIYFLLGTNIARPISSLSQVMQDLSAGNLATDVPHQDKQDEIGRMAVAIHHFKTRLIENKELQENAVKLEEKAAAERRAEQLALADGFESKVETIVRQVATGIDGANSDADVVNANSLRSIDHMKSVVESIREANTNVQTVAASSEELSASIAEISSRVAEVATTSREAASKANETNQTVEELSNTADNIGQVISLINDIAEQTNLLALNATIEAARAGEAGKGFAVVASEVKNLANQTANATSEIASQVGDMQGVTQSAVNAIKGIREIIDQVDQITTGIASAVEEQSAATNEIARSAQNASSSTGQVESVVLEVEKEAQSVNNAATSLSSVTRNLSERSRELTQEVEAFLSGIRNNQKS